MTLLLVRHAIALRRKDWTKDDALRPLTPRGERQADALPDLLAHERVERILSSPAVRCVDTVQPLAARLGLPVEVIPELEEGRGAAAADLARGLAHAVLCTHGDVLPDLLRALADAPLPPDDELPCAKGATWVVAEGGRRATYLPPPA